MSNEDKKIVLCIQNIIDIILEDKDFVIDSNRMKKIYDYFNKIKIFDDEFINRYIDFIEIFNNFFDFLIEKIEEYERDVIKYGEDLEHGYFTFNFEEFKTKESLLVYQDMIEYLNYLFNGNILLQGLIFYIHINSLLSARSFTNNKIKMSRGIPTVEIDYVARISNYKDLYMKKVRKMLQEGKRDSVFVDKSEWLSFVEKKLERDYAK